MTTAKRRLASAAAVNALTARIEVFDTTLQNVVFGDAFREPDLPEGLAPFNVQNIGRDIVVTYHRDGGEIRRSSGLGRNL